MKRLLIVSLLLTAIPAYAQQTELTIKATPAEADLIWKGLRKLPVEEVENFMQKMRQQIVIQTTPKPEPAKKEQENDPLNS